MGKRVGIIDETRGAAVISMVIYHLYFDLVYFYGLNFGGLVDAVFDRWQPLIAGTFIFIAGASSFFRPTISSAVRFAFLSEWRLPL